MPIYVPVRTQHSVQLKIYVQNSSSTDIGQNICIKPETSLNTLSKSFLLLEDESLVGLHVRRQKIRICNVDQQELIWVPFVNATSCWWNHSLSIYHVVGLDSLNLSTTDPTLNEQQTSSGLLYSFRKVRGFSLSYLIECRVTRPTA